MGRVRLVVRRDWSQVGRANGDGSPQAPSEFATALASNGQYRTSETPLLSWLMPESPAGRPIAQHGAAGAVSRAGRSGVAVVELGDVAFVIVADLRSTWALLEVGYTGYVGREFIARDPLDDLRQAVALCDA